MVAQTPKRVEVHSPPPLFSTGRVDGLCGMLVPDNDPETGGERTRDGSETGPDCRRAKGEPESAWDGWREPVSTLTGFIPSNFLDFLHPLPPGNLGRHRALSVGV